VKWIRDEAVIVLSDAGDPLFIQGVMADITEQKRSEEELVEAHKKLEMRVAQRTEALAKANEELRQSAEKLKSFAASVVHDLKSPAIGAYGLTKLLWKQYGNALDEKGRHYCDQIMKASEHVVELAEMINAYIATKETPLRIEAVDLRELLNMLREEFSPRLAVRSIDWFEPETGIVVRADRISLLRMYRNLIDNALKYGGDHLSAIRIGYEESDKFHIFSVSDDGRGVSEEDAEKIFQRFQRSSSSSGIEGAGLGLAIVREIAEKHGGRVSVNTGIERGVTFSCSISKYL
jgi:light-regulated signal transduction histidine kinase (bacteriophytochrome)